MKSLFLLCLLAKDTGVANGTLHPRLSAPLALPTVEAQGLVRMAQTAVKMFSLLNEELVERGIPTLCLCVYLSELCVCAPQ